jgi:uncharacterized protein (DUF1499 family)
MVILRKMLVSLLLVIICALIVLVTVSLVSRKTPELGILNSKLHACPEKPNCLCSEYPGNHYIEPIAIENDDLDMSKYAKIISDMGGSLHTVEENYLRATFTTPLMRFVDDFELRLDADNGLLHLRSASRVGRSDFGKNRQRIEEFKRRLGPPAID